MKYEQNLSEKINFCLGIATALKKILYALIEDKMISDKDYQCILSLAECLENSLNIMSKEFNL